MNNVQKNKTNPGEAIFSVAYLAFAFVSSVIFFARSGDRSAAICWGASTLILAAGDSFHLVPRIVCAFVGPSDANTQRANLGLQVSSISMTIFYVVLMYAWANTFPQLNLPILVVVLVWVSAVARVVICLLPQNNWFTGGNFKMSLIRNLIFVITGAYVMGLFFYSGIMVDRRMVIAGILIAFSFACYLPVCFGAKRYPKLGLLMLPKTLCYIGIIIIGLLTL